MNRTSVLTGAVALFCIFALGTSAATLDTTLGTDPDDVIDLDWRQLPLSDDRAQDIKEEIESNEQASEGQTGQAPVSEQGDRRGASSKPGEQATGGSTGSQSGLGGAGQQDLIDRLLGLLRALLPVVLAALAVLMVAGLAYRYRARLEALVVGLLAMVIGLLPSVGQSSPSGLEGSVEFEPQHEVDRAWLRLVKELNLDAVQNRTPKEVAALAKAAGLTPGAVDTLTRAFEEVRYGGKPVTEERRRVVRDGLHDLGLQRRSA